MFNPFYRYRINFVFFIGFAGFIAIFVALTTGISYTLSAREQAGKTSLYQQGMLLGLNKQVTSQTRAVEQMSLAISLNSSFLDFLTMNGDYYARNKAREQMTRDYLTPVVNSSPALLSIQVYMDDPTLVDRTADIQYLPRGSLDNEEWYNVIDKSDFVWVGERKVATAQGLQPALSFVRQIYSKDRVNIGVLVVNIKARAVETILSEDKPSSNRVLLDSGGRLMLDTGNAAVSKEITTLMKDGQLAVKPDTGYKRIRLSSDVGSVDRNSLMVWSRSFPDDWILVELTPWSEITRGSMNLARTLVVMGGVAGLLALGLTLLLSRQFTRPIRELLQMMSSYAVGRPLQAFPTGYKNEFGSLFGGYRKLIERNETLYQKLEIQYKARHEAEIQALQAMINPHFLYNTLDQLNWMAIRADQHQISHVLELMGRMFRIVLSNGENFIPLHDELMHTECYLQIQQLKWGEGLHYTVECPEQFKHYLLPKLTVQPFVENAVIHGFHGRRSGTIRIQIQEQQEDLLLTVTDDGCGISPDWASRKHKKTGGYGIRNVMERIKALFGSDYGVVLSRIPEGGTEARILVPKLTISPTKGGEEDAENRNRG